MALNFLGTIMGQAGGEALKGALTGIGDLALKVRQVITGELPAEKRAELEALALQAEIIAQQAQNAVNQAEAAHASIFVAGWRPFIGWVCGVALAYHFVAQPLAAFTISLMKWQTPPLPVFDMGSLMTILLGMLGLGAMRTYEKKTGSEKNR